MIEATPIAYADPPVPAAPGFTGREPAVREIPARCPICGSETFEKDGRWFCRREGCRWTL